MPIQSVCDDERQLFGFACEFNALLAIYLQLKIKQDLMIGQNLKGPEAGARRRETIEAELDALSEQIDDMPATSLRTMAARVLSAAWQSGRDGLFEATAPELDSRWIAIKRLALEARRQLAEAEYAISSASTTLLQTE